MQPCASPATVAVTASAETIAGALGLHRSGQGWHGRCPACGYKSGFTVTDRRDGLPLVYCHTGGCTFADLTAALARLGVWPEWQGDGERRTETETDGTAMALAVWRRSQPAAEPGGG